MASRGYSSSDRSVNDLSPPPREQCSPLRIGDRVWRGDVEHVVAEDGTIVPLNLRGIHSPPLPRRRRVLNVLVDATFCTECLRLRISPGHWLLRAWHS